VLTEEQVDRYADPQQVACAFFAHAYKVGVKNLPDGLSALEFTRNQLDRLGISAESKTIPRCPCARRSCRCKPCCCKSSDGTSRLGPPAWGT
jgi:hypothetical protein